jgi:protein-S-isoprenylcysteine O-methyltransferase Ste14
VALGSALLLLGEGLRLWAVSHLGPHGRRRTAEAPHLSTGGPYAHLRHPLYAGNALLSAGLLAFSGALLPWLPIAVAIGFVIQYAAFIRREERLLEEVFGERWRVWRREVPALLPRLQGRWGGDPARLRVREALRLEWPTVRTVLGLSLLMLARSFLIR